MSDNKEALAGESMLSRWSRRKHEAEQPAADTAESVETATSAELDAGVSAQAVEPKPLTDADMPDIETLTEDSDFSGFMSAGVSDELRNVALRKLFHASVFNIRDGLDEYDEDYTTFEKLGDIVTSDMKHQLEVQEQKRLDALAQEDASSDAVEDADLDEADADDVEMIEDPDEVEIAAAPEALQSTEPTATAVADQDSMRSNQKSDQEHE